MHVDADSLEELNLRTRDGAERAGAVFSDSIGGEARIGTTRITLASYQDLIATLISNGETCLEFALEGALSGTVILAFDGPATSLVESERPTDRHSGALLELGLDLIGAFIDEWEAHVGDDLSVANPTYVPDLGSYEFGFEAMSEETESAPLFEGGIDIGEGGTVTVFLIPDVSSLDRLLSGGAPTPEDESALGMGFDAETPSFPGAESTAKSADGRFDDDPGTASIPLDKLSVFSDLTRAGTTTAAERVTQMAGVKTTTDISGINFRPIEDVSSHLDADSFVGTTTEFTGKPSGTLVVMFPEGAAKRVAEAMLPVEPDGEGLTSMHESALEELGNLMTSGFIDGWANVLQKSVEHTPPQFSADIEMTMLELVTDQLGPFQTHAYTIESRISAAELEFTCEIHALPDEADLNAALEEMMIARRNELRADPDEVF